MTISDYYCDDGVPYYRGSDIYNFFIEQASNVLRIEKRIFETPNMKRSHLKKGDVLMSIVGAIIGNVSLVQTDADATCSCKLAIMRPKNIQPEFFAVFLQSVYGQNQIQKYKRGAAQTGLILEDFEQILIPNFSENLIIRTINFVNLAFSVIEKSKKLYAEAEQTLLKAVGLADFKPSMQNTNIKTFAQSFGASGRLDAEYYQPKYEVFENTVKSNKNGYTLIKNEYDHFNAVSRKPKAAYHYIEISDVNVSDGTNSPILIETSELPANAKFEVQKGDLIISKVRPNRGAITVIEADFDNLIVSGAFTVLREKPSSVFTKEVLKVLLRTPVYREWMLQFNVGTQYPVIRDEDILDLPIPKIDLATQTNISQLVQQSFTLKAESERLLNIAKHAVEIAIEQDENTALDYIQQQSAPSVH